MSSSENPDEIEDTFKISFFIYIYSPYILYIFSPFSKAKIMVRPSEVISNIAQVLQTPFCNLRHISL